MFKNTALLHIFEVMQNVFKDQCQQEGIFDKESVSYTNFISVNKILMECLKLYSLEIRTSANQMTFKTADTE